MRTLAAGERGGADLSLVRARNLGRFRLHRTGCGRLVQNSLIRRDRGVEHKAPHRLKGPREVGAEWLSVEGTRLRREEGELQRKDQTESDRVASVLAQTRRARAQNDRQASAHQRCE